MKTLGEIGNLLKRMPHKAQVSFALYCAEDVYPLVKDNKKAKLCIDLVKEWLRNPDRPGLEEELVAAAYAAYAARAAANATAHAVHAVVRAAYAAAHDAYNAADNAALASVHAANAAYAAHTASHEEKTQEYYGVLVGYLTNVEKEFYSQEEK
jgi:hypothetical protein